MKTVYFLGSKKIGSECLKTLYDYQKKKELRILAVLVNPKNSEDIIKFCKLKKLPILNSLSSLIEQKQADLLVSVQYHQILKKEHIQKAKLAINLHMAPLPEYRGCNQFSFAIVDKAKIFGTTLHRLEEGIDSGDIIAERRFKIPQNIWVDELQQKTVEESKLLFKQFLPNLLKDKYKLISQKKLLKKRGSKIYYRKDIENIKKIDFSWPKAKILRYLRATSMPGFPAPKLIIQNKMISLEREQ